MRILQLHVTNTKRENKVQQSLFSYLVVWLLCFCVGLLASWLLNDERWSFSLCWLPTWLRRRMTKPPKWHVRPAKTQIAVRMRKHWALITYWAHSKTLIRLGGCSGWSESSLGAHDILLVLSCGGSQVYPYFSTLPLGREKDCGLWSWDSLEIVSRFFFCFFFKFKLNIKFNEPSHEIMVLFVLRKLILQTRMRSHPVGLDVWYLVWHFFYFHTSHVRTAKALARLRGCAGSPEPSLVAYVISTIISRAASNVLNDSGCIIQCIYAVLEWKTTATVGAR